MPLLLKKYPFLLSITSGLLLAAAWPPLPFTFLLFIAFVPLLIAIDDSGQSSLGDKGAVQAKQSLKKILVLSFACFFTQGIISMNWVTHVAMDMKGEIILFVFGYFFMALLMSIPFVLFVWMKRKINSGWVWISLPALYLSYEYLQAQWDLAFMWLHLGLGLSLHPKWIRFYQLTGTAGGSLLILTSNVLFYLLIKNWKENKTRNKLMAGIAGLFLLVFVLNFALSEKENASAEKIKVAIIQGNIDPYGQAGKGSLEQQFNILKELTLSVKEQHPDLILCSEGFFKDAENTSLVINTIDEHPLVKQIKELSLEMNAPVLTGMIAYKLYRTNTQPTPSAQYADSNLFVDALNTAMLISHDQPTQVYDKTKLVPFMERVPFLDKFSFMEMFHLDLNKISGSYGRTNTTPVLHYKNMKIAPVICMESLFPDHVRAFVNKDANIIAVLTDDGWSGHSNGPYQHAAFTVPLAVEMQRAVLRSANTGISLFVDKNGVASEQAEWAKKQVIVKEVSLNPEKSFYVRWGNLIGMTSLFLSVALLSAAIFKRAHPQ